MRARTLRGMICVVTGASSGIGRALAVELSKQGARLVLAARRETVLERLNFNLGSKHLVIPTDVSEPDDCKRLIDGTFDHYGRLDTLVCNAGFGSFKAVHETTPDEMIDIYRTNVIGTTECMRHATGPMSKQPERDGLRGQMVLVSSAAARRGIPYLGPYSATKAAQLSIAEAARVELAPMNIHVMSVHPVGTDTDFFDVAQSKGDRQATGRDKDPFRQSAETVAKAIVSGIKKPKREVWPSVGFKYALGLNAFAPAVGDGAMTKMRKQMDAEEESLQRANADGR